MKKNVKTPLRRQLSVSDDVLQGITGGCGGMTQVDPPSLELDSGPTGTVVDPVRDGGQDLT